MEQEIADERKRFFFYASASCSVKLTLTRDNSVCYSMFINPPIFHMSSPLGKQLNEAKEVLRKKEGGVPLTEQDYKKLAEFRGGV